MKGDGVGGEGARMLRGIMRGMRRRGWSSVVLPEREAVAFAWRIPADGGDDDQGEDDVDHWGSFRVGGAM